jgi:hypothetical protein
MIRPGRGSRLFRCTVCQCWESSSLSDIYVDVLQELQPRCTACRTHTAWWGSHGEQVGAWHGYWPREATRGMERDPRGFLYWPPGRMPTVAAWNRETVVAWLAKKG